jgi:O-acetyl-ADP-ribose deacetylase (regulator of RNase III)
MENNKKKHDIFNLLDYKDKINLDKSFIKKYNFILKNFEKEETINKILNYLSTENKTFNPENPNISYKEKRKLIRALLNVRSPKPIESSILDLLNRLLQSELLEAGIINVDTLEPISKELFDMELRHGNKLYLWKGDITKINSDAIVNAANNTMLGCFTPLHNCIDNAIHSASGPQLRDDCNKIISLQGKPESVGLAKVTKAYNLPSKFVIHTVGPNVSGLKNIISFHKKQLESCYKECLDTASKIDSIKTLTLCSISTGVSAFPKNIAAEIAIKVTIDFLDHNPNRFEKIIFNTYTDYDYSIFSKSFYSVKEQLKHNIF